MIVSDYTAIINAQGGLDGPVPNAKPATITYSFSTSAPAYLASGYSQSFLASFIGFDDWQKAEARGVMKQWADASGLVAVEVSEGVGDVNFGFADFYLAGIGGVAGFAETLTTAATSFVAGDVFLNSRQMMAHEASFNEVLIHEVGHALGLKHTHDGDPTLAVELDTPANSVMTYRGHASVLGTFDKQAIAALYGPNSADRTDITAAMLTAPGTMLTLTGTAGADYLRGAGAAGGNRVEGGAGDDRLAAATARDELYGGAGNDTLSGAAAVIDGGDGDDRIWLSAEAASVIRGGAGSDTAIVSMRAGQAVPAFSFDGGAGFDSLDLNIFGDRETASVAFSLTDLIAAGSRFVDVELIRIYGSTFSANQLPGSALADPLSGAARADVLRGLGGNDALWGGGGDDWLDGGDGNDTLSGDAGADVLIGGAGDDRLTGGAGADRYVFRGSALGADRITDFAYGVDTIDLDGRAFTAVATNATGTLLTYAGGTIQLDGVAAHTLAEWNAQVAAAPAQPAPVAALPTGDQFVLAMASGGQQQVQGSGRLVGTAGYQYVMVQDAPAKVTFDASFNQGGDVVTLPGKAASWSAVRTGSSVLLTDGDTSLTIPVGTVGTALAFGDGYRTLVFDPAAGAVKIGAHVVTGSAAAIGGEGATKGPAGPIDFAASSSMAMVAGGSATAASKVTVFGTAGKETVYVKAMAEATFDASFNQGGDTLVLQQRAGSYTAARSGSSVVLHVGYETLTIPVGTAGMTIVFDDGAQGVLRFDTGTGQVMLGGTAIGTSVAQLPDVLGLTA